LNIQGVWFNQGSAQKHNASLQVKANGYVISIEGGLVLEGEMHELTVSDRIANAERKLTLRDGSVFASRENDAIDNLVGSSKNVHGVIHILESHLGWIMVALVITICATIAGFRWGIPLASEVIAHALPYKTNELIASKTLSFLDEFTFKPSQLSAAKKRRIRDHFWKTLVPLSEHHQQINYTLHFRAWDYEEKSIPNAFALPSGDIILTDQFINLSQNQEQIDAVLLHEMGHVVHRHSLQKLIETTLVGAAIVMLSGDSNSAADMGIGLGSLLVSSHYSRNHEYEADAYAFEKMLLAGIDPQRFTEIMRRMQHFMNSTQKSQINTHAGVLTEAQVKPPLGKIVDYLSSHPSTEKRMQQAIRYRQCFRQDLTICKYQ
tara:strand:- start:133 stop:1263 length:1131 start_codon:yes stop_codon:yes gene_type:complete